MSNIWTLLLTSKNCEKFCQNMENMGTKYIILSVREIRTIVIILHFLRSSFMIASSKWKSSSKLSFSSSPSLLDYMYNMFWKEACFIAWNHSRLLAKPLSWQQGLWISIEKYTLTLTEKSRLYFLDNFFDVVEEIWICKLAKYETPLWKIWYPSLYYFVIT